MRRKLSGYFLLSFFSFCFFTVVFLALANVQVSADQSPLTEPENAPPVQYVPTPTIYREEIRPASSPTIEETKIPSPTPTVYITQSHVLAAVTKAPTPEPTKTVETTPVPPTAIPTPTDTPTPTVTPIVSVVPQPSSTDLDAFFSQYAATYSVSSDELKKIAACESDFNTNSDTGTYAGMFQFSASTWESTRGAMGLDPNPDLRKNPEEAIKTTAFMLARGEQNAWPNCH